MNIYADFAVRLYVNPKFGKFVRPGRTNPYIFNGSVGFRSSARKLFVDMADFDHLTESVPDLRSYGIRNFVIDHARAKLSYAGANPADFAAGQLFELEREEKIWTIGFVVMNMITNKAFLMWTDGEALLAEGEFVLRSCRTSSTNGKAPDYLGANYDLGETKSQPVAASSQSPQLSQMLEAISQRNSL